jgi:hypothetical protein
MEACSPLILSLIPCKDPRTEFDALQAQDSFTHAELNQTDVWVKVCPSSCPEFCLECCLLEDTLLQTG